MRGEKVLGGIKEGAISDWNELLLSRGKEKGEGGVREFFLIPQQGPGTFLKARRGPGESSRQESKEGHTRWKPGFFWGRKKYLRGKTVGIVAECQGNSH